LFEAKKQPSIKNILLRAVTLIKWHPELCWCDAIVFRLMLSDRIRQDDIAAYYLFEISMENNSQSTKFSHLESEVKRLREEIKVLNESLAVVSTLTDFSQLGEERVVINILERMRSRRELDKFYLDIGAFHPVSGSNTLKLYQLGWRGIVVEPNPSKTAEWSKFRPNDVVISKAVVPDSWLATDVTMRCSNHLDAREAVTDDVSANSRLSGNGSLSYRAPAIKTIELFEEAQRREMWPSFVNIDIEGLEEAVVLGSEFYKRPIPVLCIEHLLSEFGNEMSILEYSKSKLVTRLLQFDYLLVSVCGISLIFCHKDFYVPYY
jgi:FkbM family methyltransferase